MGVHRIRHHLPRPAYLITAIILAMFFLVRPPPPLAGGNVALAQSPITVEVDRTSLTVDEQLLLTVTITGDMPNIPGPDLSAMTDFGVVGSSTSTQISIINGELTSQGSFTYRLQPLRTGSLIIPPLNVEIDGQTHQTNPIEIEVLAGSAPNSAPGADVPSTEAPSTLEGQNFFVEAEVDNARPYLGQQIVYTFRLFQAANFLGQPDYQPPPFIDFWGQTTLSQPNYNRRAAGRDYLVTEIRTALFPANVGPVTIAPAKFVIPGGLFEPDIVLDTEPVTVEVQSWPEDAPANFNGAVGQFEISARLSETQGKVNEPLTLVVAIKGGGNIETLSEPSLPELPNWRAFDSQTSTTTEVRNDVVYGTRRFERLIVPSLPGQHSLPPIEFSYFNPESGQYVTIQTDPIPVTVLPGDQEPPLATLPGADPQSAAAGIGDIRHIKSVPASLSRARRSILTHPFYWICWTLPVLMVGLAWVWQRQRQRLLADTAYARRLRARRIAYAILNSARPDQDSFAAAHRALLGYLSDKLNRPTVGLTTEALINLLWEAQLDPNLIQRVRATLERIDVSRFAPIEDTTAQSLLDETRQLINDMENSFGSGR